jgi:hypothetical protein
MHILFSLDVTAHYYVFIDTKAIMHLIPFPLLKRHQCDPLPPALASAAKRQRWRLACLPLQVAQGGSVQSPTSSYSVSYRIIF